MKQLSFEVNGQYIKRSDDLVPVAKSRNYFYAHFDFKTPEWTKRGYITKHGIENFTEMYDAYHTLGGNGMITHLLKEVKELPIKD